MSFYDHPDRQWDNARMAPTQPAGEPSSLRGLSTALTVLFIGVAAVSLLCVVAYAGRVGYVSDVLESGRFDPDAAGEADTFVGGAEILWTLLFLAIAPVFIVWQYRHAKNGRILGAADGVSSPGWAIGGWFIPLANLVIPALNLYVNGRASDPKGQHAAVRARRGPAIVVVWAVCFALAAVLDRAIGAGLPEPEDADYLEQLQNADGVAVAANIGFLATAVLAIAMVRRLTARQELALATRPARSGGPAAYASWPPPSPHGPPPYGQQPQPYATPPPYSQNPAPAPYKQPPPATPYSQNPPTTPYTQEVPPAQPTPPLRPAPPSPFARPSAPPAGGDPEPGAPSPPIQPGPQP